MEEKVRERKKCEVNMGGQIWEGRNDEERSKQRRNKQIFEERRMESWKVCKNPRLQPIDFRLQREAPLKEHAIKAPRQGHDRKN